MIGNVLTSSTTFPDLNYTLRPERASRLHAAYFSESGVACRFASRLCCVRSVKGKVQQYFPDCKWSLADAEVKAKITEFVVREASRTREPKLIHKMLSHSFLKAVWVLVAEDPRIAKVPRPSFPGGPDLGLG